MIRGGGAVDAFWGLVKTIQPDGSLRPAVQDEPLDERIPTADSPIIRTLRGARAWWASLRGESIPADEEARERVRERIRNGLTKLADQQYPPKLTRAALGNALGYAESTVSDLEKAAGWSMNDVKQVYAEILASKIPKKT